MARFDLGDDVRADRPVSLSPQRAWTLGRGVIAGYVEEGFAVEFTEEDYPRGLAARLTSAEGSDVRAALEVAARPEGGAVIAVALDGAVEIGGMEAMFASEALVRTMAKQKLEVTMDVVIDRADAGPAPRGAAAVEAAPAGAPPVAAPQAPEHAPGSVGARLVAAKRMLEEGLIDEADFRAARGRILESL